jgi:hypothetical protein
LGNHLDHGQTDSHTDKKKYIEVVPKFECMRYWPEPAAAPAHQYLSPENQEIQVKSDLRDLGVQLSSNLRFSVYIENTVTAASKLVGWGLRAFSDRGRKVMLTLLKSLVQHKLDYWEQLWSPADQTFINKLEAVQRHMVNRVRDFKLDILNYCEKLHLLRLYSQERRRERYMVIFLCKINQGMVSVFDVEFSMDGGRRSRTIMPKTVVRSAPSMVRNARERSLAVRGAQIYLICCQPISGA